MTLISRASIGSDGRASRIALSSANRCGSAEAQTQFLPRPPLSFGQSSGLPVMSAFHVARFTSISSGRTLASYCCDESFGAGDRPRRADPPPPLHRECHRQTAKAAERMCRPLRHTWRIPRRFYIMDADWYFNATGGDSRPSRDRTAADCYSARPDGSRRVRAINLEREGLISVRHESSALDGLG